MLLARLAATSRAVAATSSRTGKVALLAACLAEAEPHEVPVVVSYLSGALRQRRTGIGWASLRDLPVAADVATLEVADVDRALQRASEVSGAGSQGTRRELLGRLMSAATADEQWLLAGLLSGELRQGALDAVVLEAVAAAAGVDAAEVRTAVTLAGALPPVAQAVLADGPAGLTRFRLTVGRPLRPMLAQSAPDVATAIARVPGGDDGVAVDRKLDGIRIQVHKDGGEVGIFSRTLDDLTDRLPEVVGHALALPVRSAVLDGEAIALRPDGRPHPFQVTGSRTGRVRDVAAASADVPLSWFAFDALHLDGTDLVAEPASTRFGALAEYVPGELVVPRLLTADPAEAAEFFAAAVSAGHEGVVVKALSGAYEAGRRGAGWVKVKPRHTLDLVVLAAEWGHGRRTGHLSNLHLGARDPASGGFVMLGKTFKGLTDELLRWQTERLLALATSPTDDWVVHVRPELVVEIAFDGVQTSRRYPAGMALRFARVLRYRPDKPASDANTVADVRRLHT